MESFNGKLRDELLNVEVFDTLWEAKVLAERWRREYNQRRPHSALGLSASGARGQTPQVAGTGSYPLAWTSNGPRSNLRSGLVFLSALRSRKTVSKYSSKDLGRAFRFRLLSLTSIRSSRMNPDFWSNLSKDIVA